ncbi:MAG: hypothetical protein KGI71_02475 [Patescibacteria group bacterium]|nr:hypothetical protein [Patescibacteria group bacterium]
MQAMVRKAIPFIGVGLLALLMLLLSVFLRENPAGKKSNEFSLGLGAQNAFADVPTKISGGSCGGSGGSSCGSGSGSGCGCP